MKKNIYVKPIAKTVVITTHQCMLAGSNQFTGSSINFNYDSMEESDGGESASRASRFSEW